MLKKIGAKLDEERPGWLNITANSAGRVVVLVHRTQGPVEVLADFRMLSNTSTSLPYPTNSTSRISCLWLNARKYPRYHVSTVQQLRECPEDVCVVEVPHEPLNWGGGPSRVVDVPTSPRAVFVYKNSWPKLYRVLTCVYLKSRWGHGSWRTHRQSQPSQARSGGQDASASRGFVIAYLFHDHTIQLSGFSARALLELTLLVAALALFI